MSDIFYCYSCCLHKPFALKAKAPGKRPVCIGCNERINRLRNEKEVRVRGATLESIRRSKHKETAKQYREGVVPDFAKD